MYTDTPVPQEEPAGDNPPDGAMIDYYLNAPAREVRIDILYQTYMGFELNGKLVRTYSNTDTLYKIGNVNIPHYWIRPQQTLSTEPGHHRFVWDMKYTPLNISPSYPISATYRNTEPNPTSPWIMPGHYIVRLTVDGRIFNQTFNILMDRRVKASQKTLQSQYDLSLQCYEGRKECMKIIDEIHLYRSQLKSQLTTLSPSAID
jgi:hypothetical protein